jgi:hypothetical protein
MLEVTERSAEIAEILSGRVTAPVPLKYGICGGSGQDGIKAVDHVLTGPLAQ